MEDLGHGVVDCWMTWGIAKEVGLLRDLGDSWGGLLDDLGGGVVDCWRI